MSNSQTEFYNCISSQETIMVLKYRCSCSTNNSDAWSYINCSNILFLIIDISKQGNYYWFTMTAMEGIETADTSEQIDDSLYRWVSTCLYLWLLLQAFIFLLTNYWKFRFWATYSPISVSLHRKMWFFTPIFQCNSLYC